MANAIWTFVIWVNNKAKDNGIEIVAFSIWKSQKTV